MENFTHYLTQELSNNLISEMEKIFIEGLKRKGFEFSSKIEIERFVSTRCRCDDNIQHKEKMYYVDDVPFLLHLYAPINDFEIETNCTDRQITMSANLGHYTFID